MIAALKASFRFLPLGSTLAVLECSGSVLQVPMSSPGGGSGVPEREYMMRRVRFSATGVHMWVNVAARGDLSAFQKVVWILISVFWGIGPIMYLIVGGGTL